MTGQEVDRTLGELRGLRRDYFCYLLDTMPLSDRWDYPAALFLSFAGHAVFLRERVERCRAMDEGVFRDYVLYHRVNNEGLVDCRGLFARELLPRVEGLEDGEAALEVNRWCHEHATYRLSDGRTLSPLDVWRSGLGRCGEESVFLVSALRSAGLPARQVYAPRWSHCEDNHAWVEVFCGGEWHYLGACEPEPVLDRGWFQSAASRALVIHSRTFGRSGEADARLGCARLHHQTSRYAHTQRRAFRVTDRRGAPVAGAWVTAHVLNMAELVPIEQYTTGADGAVHLDLGLGDVYLTAGHGGEWAESFCPAGEDALLRLAAPPSPDGAERAFDFAAPPDDPTRTTALDTAQRAVRRAVLERGTKRRAARESAFYDGARAARCPGAEDLLRAARGNFDEVYRFLRPGEGDGLRQRLLRTLAEKDLMDSRAEVLEDHLAGARAYEGAFPPEVFERALLCPRVALERLTPYRAALSGAFTPAQREVFRRDPARLWAWLCRKVEEDEEAVYPELYVSPVGALSAGRCDGRSRRVLFVAACRSLGVPARLRALDGAAQYWLDGAFHFAEPVREGSIRLRGGEGLVYRKAWTLARLEGGRWQTLELPGESLARGPLDLTLPEGIYRTVTASRTPDGNQLALRRDFTVREGQRLGIALNLRRGDPGEALGSWELPPFSALTEEGRMESRRLFGRGRPALLFWLDEGMEPTEHVLQELSEARERLRERPVRLLFFLRSPEAADQPTLRRLLRSWPEITVCWGDWEDNLELLARRLFLDPDRPPLAVACDGEGRAVYAGCGYNVGLVEALVNAAEAVAGQGPFTRGEDTEW